MPTRRTKPKLSPNAVAYLQQQLVRSSSSRLSALEHLGRTDDQQIYQTVLAILQDPTEDLTLRQSAARALGRIGQVQAVQPLIAMFRTQAVTVDPDPLGSMRSYLILFGIIWLHSLTKQQ